MLPNIVGLFIFSCCFVLAPGLKILGLFPHPGLSHFDVFEPLLKALAEKGHEVTVVSHFPQKRSLPRYHDISLKGDTDILKEFIKFDMIPQGRLKYYKSIWLLQSVVQSSCKGLRTKEMQELIKTDEKYDLILMEMFNSDCFLGFVHKFKIPFIGLSSCIIMPWTQMRFANPVNPAYIPSVFSKFSDDMSLAERAENVIFFMYSKFVYANYMLSISSEELKKHFGHDLPNIEEIYMNASLLLVNTHFTINRPKPLVPNIIEIGGMFLKEVQTLPQNIEKWINESSHGVVYFSMGSMIKGHSFPEETRQAFLKAFARFPQRFLWKWENDSLPGQPDNVMIQKWMPQYDILCHPNVKAFLSHGGLLGTTEAVNCGVPVVVMPQYGDQFVNAAALQANGGGVILDFHEATEESVYNALKTVLEPSFNKNVKKLSAAFRDRPLPPLETAIYWVEYVARHGGAPFMRTKAVGMPWYKYLLLDVVAFLVVVFIAAMAVLFYALKFMAYMLVGRPQKIKSH